MATIPLEASASDDVIRTVPHPTCRVCRTVGRPLYRGLTDRLFGSRGEWTLRHCPQSGCGLLWLDPMPREEDLPKAYRRYFTHRAPPPSAPPSPRPPRFAAWRALERRALADYRAARYAVPLPECRGLRRLLALAISLSPLHRAVTEASALYLQPIPGGRLLDVGCGDGTILEALSTLGWNVEGVEWDPEGAASARARGFAVQVGTVADFATASVDAIVMSHVLEHVVDPLATLRECRRVLKPGGRLAIVTPNARSIGHRFCGRDWLGLDPPRHLHVFTAPALHSVAVAAGFPESVVRTTYHAAVVFTQGSLMQKRPSHAFGDTRIPLHIELAGRLVLGLEGLASLVGRGGEELVLVTTRKGD